MRLLAQGSPQPNLIPFHMLVSMHSVLTAHSLPLSISIPVPTTVGRGHRIQCEEVSCEPVRPCCEFPVVMLGGAWGGGVATLGDGAATSRRPGGGFGRIHGAATTRWWGSSTEADSAAMTTGRATTDVQREICPWTAKLHPLPLATGTASCNRGWRDLQPASTRATTLDGNELQPVSGGAANGEQRYATSYGGAATMEQ